MRRVSVRHRPPALRDLGLVGPLALPESAQHWHDHG
jgi:hypothetical protein